MTLHCNIRVNLTGSAPSNGAVIEITSSDPQVLPVPASVYIQPNYTQKTTQVTCPSPAAEGHVTITAKYLGETKVDGVTLEP